MASRIGVIVPAYNEEAHISRCLDSLISQTIISTVEFKIFVIDDGSTDATPHIINRYLEKYPQLFEVFTQENCGRGCARNRGLKSALNKCDYIGFVDADDKASPILYESLYEAIKDKGKAIALSDYEATDQQGFSLFRYYEGSAEDFGGNFLFNKRQMQFFGASLCNKLFSREVLLDIRFPEGIDFEDLACTYGIGYRADEIVKVDLSLYHYYQETPGSVMAARDEHYLDIIPALEYMLDDFERLGALEPLRAQLSYVAVLHLLRGRMRDLFVTRKKDLIDTYIDKAYELLDRRLPLWREDLKKNKILKSSVVTVLSSKSLLKLYTRFSRFTGF